jgi:signal transduction histidine kinase/CheY-like chemotaxis protein
MRVVDQGGAKPRLSFSSRLIGLVVAAVGTGMLVFAVISSWQQSVQFADNRRELLLATARVFSAAVAASAWDRDRNGALSAIRAISNLPDILYAEVRTTDGAVLAAIGSAPRLIGDLTLDGKQSIFGLFSSRTVEISVPIIHGGQAAGRLLLIGGTEGLKDRLMETVVITVLGGFTALLVGLMVAWRFQRGITRPLKQLMRAMADIREHHRYDVTVDDAGDREIGMLVDGFNAMLRDIRDRDMRLETHRLNLEVEVSDRTRELRQARDAADAANRAKSDFLATMSHEIRTPMNGVMAMAELLVKAELPRRQRRYAEVIAQSGQTLISIINDILDFSKIESGKLELESTSIDLNEVVDNVISLFAERAHGKGVDLAAFVDPRVPRRITGDYVRLTQIVSNLVNNALKFTEHGFVRVTIEPADDARDLLRVAVEDTGIGIPAAKIETIFEPFSQADQSTTRQFGGTGLGLAICKRLAETMGGRIEVLSRHGRGSTFTVMIPTSGASDVRPWPQLAVAASRSATCIVELAGSATAVAAARYFAAFGYSALNASEGVSATDYAAASLVCIDADKLGLKGLGLRPYRKAFVVVVARFSDESADQLVAAGLADAVISKPVLRSEIEELLARIAAGELVVPSLGGRPSENARLYFSGLKVLVADDNAVNREVAVESLSQLGATVETVENGRQAIDAVQKKIFDLVLMDGSMPDIDGFAAARRIRAAEAAMSLNRLPIVALTAHVLGTSAQAWREAGMDDVIYKPLTLGQLSACLQRLFPERAQASPNAKTATVSAARSPGTTENLLDPNVMQELHVLAAAGRQDFFHRILNLYLENAPRAAGDIVNAARMNDAEGMGRSAHSLKSMSYNLGAMPVAARAEAVERVVQERVTPANLVDLAPLLSTLQATLAAVNVELARVQHVSLTISPTHNLTSTCHSTR